MFSYKKGQGATEYLVLLAVVMVIALVVIALLGFFPGLAGDAKMTQSASYWSSEASPFSVQEQAVQGSTGQVSLVMENMDASGTSTITNISMATADGSCSNATMQSFGSGQTITMYCTNGNLSGAPGSTYSMDLNITYKTPYGLTKVEYGSTPIIGKYT